MLQDRHQLLEPPHASRRGCRRRQNRRRLRPLDQDSDALPAGRGRAGALLARRASLPRDSCSWIATPPRQPKRAACSRTQIEREKMSVAGFRALPRRPVGLRRGGAQDLAPHRAGVRQLERRHRRGHVQSPAVHGAPARRKDPGASDPVFYIPSLSASTIVYKGMVMPQFLAQFYPDLKDPRMEASVVVFHQRFSTNTLPQWRLAHPYRYLAHNGEINTVQGNRSWAVARGPLFRSPLLPDLRRRSAGGIAHGFGFSVARQHARALAGGRSRSHARHAHADAAGVAVGRHDRSGSQGLLRVLRDAHGAVGRPGRHRAHRRPVCVLHPGPQRPAARALGHHQESAHHHRLRGGRLGLPP